MYFLLSCFKLSISFHKKWICFWEEETSKYAKEQTPQQMVLIQPFIILQPHQIKTKQSLFMLTGVDEETAV